MSENPANPAPGALNLVSRLPEELKIMVLEQYLRFPRTITSKSHLHIFQMRALPFMTNASSSKLTMKTYYGINTFQVLPEDVDYNYLPTREMCHYMRHLEVKMYVLRPQNGISADLARNGYDWNLAWTSRFPKLQKVDLLLDFQASSVMFYSVHPLDICREESVAFIRYSAVLSAVVAALRPAELQVATVCVGCPWRVVEHAAEDCDCAAKFVERITNHITASIAT
jgi:hypothetical protein